MPAPERQGWLRRHQFRVALALILMRSIGGLLQYGAQVPAVVYTLLAAMLGGCLWWVARRQVTPAAGLLALLLYLACPVWNGGLDAAAALGLFVLLYTAVGVAHAMQGPRRKWGPRLGLLGAASMGTALASPPAAFLGVALAAACMLYLGAGRRRVLIGVITMAALLATGASCIRLTVVGFAPQLLVRVPPPALIHFAGVLLALAAGLALWVGSRRSRFFGNTAPLLGAAVCLALGQREWALPLVLLFVAGAVGDGLESPYRRLWTGIAALSVLLQAGAAFAPLVLRAATPQAAGKASNLYEK